MPILGRVNEPPGGFYECPLSAVRFDVPISCSGTEVAYVYPMGGTRIYTADAPKLTRAPARDATTCNKSLTCNFMGSDCDHLDPATCQAACNSVAGACVTCAYGEHCVAPLNLTKQQCDNAVAASALST